MNLTKIFVKLGINAKPYATLDIVDEECKERMMKKYEFALDYVRNKQVLEVGCDGGHGCSLLSTKAKSIIGIDILYEVVEIARKHYPDLTFLVMDARNMLIPDNQFDVVVSFETLEHVVESDIFVSEIKRVLKPNGIAIISAPIKNKTPFHVAYFTSDKFMRLFEKYFHSCKFYGQSKRFRPIPFRRYVERFFGIKRSNEIIPLNPNSNIRHIVGVGLK